MEKYRTWSDCNGDVESTYTKDELLTTVTIYWVTNTIGVVGADVQGEPELSVGDGRRGEGAHAGGDWRCSRRRSPSRHGSGPERSWDLRRWVQMPRGGHFAALEEPELLAHEVREFFRPFRG